MHGNLAYAVQRPPAPSTAPGAPVARLASFSPYHAQNRGGHRPSRPRGYDGPQRRTRQRLRRRAPSSAVNAVLHAQPLHMLRPRLSIAV